MIISNGWQLAHMVIHSAFEQLNLAYQNKNNDMSLNKLVTSVILFQSGMESLYYFMCSYDSKLQKKGSFKELWRNAFKGYNSDFNFDKYGDFYTEIRNAIAHPETEKRINKVNNLDFKTVYLGFKSGWEAFEELSSLTGKSHDNNSWEIMCSIHSLPSQV